MYKCYTPNIHRSAREGIGEDYCILFVWREYKFLATGSAVTERSVSKLWRVKSGCRKKYWYWNYYPTHVHGGKRKLFDLAVIEN